MPFEYTRSAIQLPNRRLTAAERAAWIEEYNNNGGASAFELALIAAINHERVSHGLNEVQIDESLMLAARFYAQTIANHNFALSNSVGPYGGSLGTAESFGAVMSFNGGGGNMGGWSYTAIVTLWMNSVNNRAFILSPSHRYIGFGSHLGGRNGVVHHLYLSAFPSN